MLVKNKTGVGYCQEYVIRQMIKNDCSFEIVIPADEKKYIDESKKYHNKWIKNYLKVGKEIPSHWRRHLPIEFSFGYHPLYFMNTGMQHTVLPCKKIAWVHDLMSVIYPEYYDASQKKFQDEFLKRIKYADYLVATSKTTKSDIIKYCNITANKIKVLYNGIDDSFFEDKGVEPIDSDIDFAKKYLCYIGDMRGHKNLMNAIKGFEKYTFSAKEEVYFYIAGNQNYEYPKLLKYVKEHGLKEKVLFLGYISDNEKKVLYKKAWALLFVSEYEGFGIPIIEAMASKTAVITSNVSSMKEIAEGYAILAEPTSVQSICEAIAQLEDEEKRSQLVEKAYQYSKKFQWSKRAQEFVKLLQGFL